MLPRRLRPSKKGCGFANYLVYEQFNLPPSTSGLDDSKVRAIASDDKGVWIIAFGSPRAIYFRSEDNGETWTELSVNDAPNFAPPYYNSLTNNFAIEGMATDGKGHWKSFGEDRKMYASNDNGKTWFEEINLQSIYPLDTDDEFLNTILRTDNNGVWFAIGTANASGFVTDTIRSLDNGATWSLYEGKTPESFYMHDICSDKNGIWYGPAGGGYTAKGDMNICKSMDNGETWTEVTVFPKDTAADPEKNHSCGSMYASTNGTIVAGFSGKYFTSPGDEWESVWYRETIARSEDKGETWEIVYPDVETGSYGSTRDMITDNNGFWMATSESGLNAEKNPMCSYDDGKTWFGGPVGFTVGARKPSPIAYGNNRFILGGKSRRALEPANSIHALDELSRTKQFVTGYGSCHSSGTGSQQPDEPVCTDTERDKLIFDRFVLDPDFDQTYTYQLKHSGGTWITMAHDGQTDNVYRSTDKGETWNRMAILDESIYSISLETNGNGKWMLMDSPTGKCFVSDDDGVSWEERTLTGLDAYASKMTLTCDRRTDRTPTWFIWGGDVSTEYKHSYRSTDDGVTWTRIVTPPGGVSGGVIGSYDAFNSIEYVGDGKWCATFMSVLDKIFLSIDGGVTWNPVFYEAIHSGYATTNVFGHIIKSNGKGTVIQYGSSNYLGPAAIYRSTDYGQSWTKINEGMNSYAMAEEYELIMTDGEGMWYSTGLSSTFMKGVVSVSFDDGATWQAGPIGFNLQPNNTSYYNWDYARFGDYGDGRFIVGTNYSHADQHYYSRSRIK